MKDPVKELDRIEGEVRSGNSKAIEEQHRRGRLTARERIDLFFDPGSFVEIAMFAQHQCHDFGMENRRPYGDGVITGYGTVEGRRVFAYAQDFTVLGGTVGFTTATKIAHAMRLALTSRSPMVGFVDTAGGRIQEGSGTYSLMFYEHIISSGVIPQISCILGACAGGGCYSPALTDFIFMVDGISEMYITGPRVIKEVTNQDVTGPELGGPKVHSEISGVADFVAGDEKECMAQVRKLLGFLPSNRDEQAPVLKPADDPCRSCPELDSIVPDSPRKPFDMLRVIRALVDGGDFFEVKERFARNMITGFARIDGYPVGIVANQSRVLAGAIDSDASDKAARFYRVCDCFNVPIITLADVPGYLPGIRQEHMGIIRHGAKMLYGYVEAEVPKILLVVRKAYGGSWAAMGSKTMGADLVFAWPTAEMAIMGAEGAAEILYKREIEGAEDKAAMRKQKIDEYREKFSSPYHYAGKMVVDFLIKPRDTRAHLFRALEVFKHKKKSNVDRGHGNIPL
ncbi:MAG TPA: acyl-CoA carboxylase subunit beta [Syntrophales bacterium]|nr:acyl-CoA carboxylase subunit beta [Syntrophales bacterium]